MMNNERVVISSLLSVYTLLLLVSLALLVFSGYSVAKVFTLLWLGLTLVALVGVVLICAFIIIRNLYSKKLRG